MSTSQQVKAFSKLFMAALEETVLGSKVFIAWSSWEIGAHHLLRIDNRLKTLCRKECPGRTFID